MFDAVDDITSCILVGEIQEMDGARRVHDVDRNVASDAIHELSCTDGTASTPRLLLACNTFEATHAMEEVTWCG